MESLQSKQKSIVPDLNDDDNTKYQTIIGLANDTLKLVEHDKSLYLKLVKDLEDLHLSWLRKTCNGNEENQHNTEFPFSGYNNKKIEKRKKSSYY